MCKDGPCTVIYGSEAPGGVWYGKLDEAAVEEICEQHLEGGTPVEKYRI
jgi:(2Fe-2S) ferredoxin